MILEIVFLAKLPKWFGVRPGKKSGEPDTPEEEDNSHVEADEDLLELEKEGIDAEEAEEEDKEEYIALQVTRQDSLPQVKLGKT